MMGSLMVTIMRSKRDKPFANAMWAFQVPISTERRSVIFMWGCLNRMESIVVSL